MQPARTQTECGVDELRLEERLVVVQLGVTDSQASLYV